MSAAPNPLNSLLSRGFSLVLSMAGTPISYNGKSKMCVASGIEEHFRTRFSAITDEIEPMAAMLRCDFEALKIPVEGIVKIKGKEFKPLGRFGSDRAKELVLDGAKLFARRNRRAKKR